MGTKTMKVAIIGATGYSGIELVRFLLGHPHVEISCLISVSKEGDRIAEHFPHLHDVCQHTLEGMDIQFIKRSSEFVFFATPAGVSREYLPQLVDAGLPCVDLSGDFRLRSGETYRDWYKKEPADQKYLEQAVYGLTEFYTEELKAAPFVANPGCYPTATLLGLIPVVKEGWIHPGEVIIDAKSGVSGAGRSASLATHYAEINENVKAYKFGAHQHIPEIEQELKRYDENIQFTFTTHLIPMTRGIMTTIYTKLKEDRSAADVYRLYQKSYQKHPFVRVRPLGTVPFTKEVYGSNFCDIGLYVEEKSQRLIIVSVIDNVVKGAAGQAIQNMNVINGWSPETGLGFTAVYP